MVSGAGYEIDFHAVGDGERSGDAITVRYGFPGAYKVMVVDGGNKESGYNLVDHIKKYYRTSHVDYLVNTHPDIDHASGLEVVLNNLTVGEVWVHRPWNYPSLINSQMKDGRITTRSLRGHLKDALGYAYAVEEIARQKRIPIKEPFQGSQIGEFRVASPPKEWYLKIIPCFDKGPDAKDAASIAAGLFGLGLQTKASRNMRSSIGLSKTSIGGLGSFEGLRRPGSTLLTGSTSAPALGALSGLDFRKRTSTLLTGNTSAPALGALGGLFASFKQPSSTTLADSIFSIGNENWSTETLKEDVKTSYENESSVVLYANFNGRGILLTGDAGVKALNHTVNYLEMCGIYLPDTLDFIQIPHHGSRHNVSPTILNRLLGPKQLFGGVAKIAFVSAGATSNTHPRRVVTNAFKRRGVRVFEAKGKNIRHSYNMPARQGWSNAIELPLYNKVET